MEAGNPVQSSVDVTGEGFVDVLLPIVVPLTPLLGGVAGVVIVRWIYGVGPDDEDGRQLAEVTGIRSADGLFFLLGVMGGLGLLGLAYASGAFQ